MARTKDAKLHAKRQQQILNAAKQCFVLYGFHQSSMRKILEQSGISAGTAYHYYSSKADIVKGLVEEELADVVVLEQRLAAANGPREGIANLVADIIAYTDREAAIIASEIHAEACRNPEISALTNRVNAKLHSLISDAIKSGRKSGSITKQHSASELTDWVISVYEGYIGKIAIDDSLKRKRCAKIAKSSVLQFLAPD